jgi:hypothetical protein
MRCAVALAILSLACTNRTDLRVHKALGDPCVENAECPETCIGGVCASYSASGGQCEEVEDCVTGLVCSSGVCDVDYCDVPERLSNAPYANSGEPGIDGASAATAFAICTVPQLRALEATPADWGAHFELRRDLDLAGSAVVIGTFTGTFDGHDHVVSGYLHSSEDDRVGLFSIIDGGTLVNLVMADADITGDRQVGAFAGTVQNGATLANLHLAGNSTVRGNCLAGGIAGLLDGVLRDSSTASGTRIVARTSSCSEHGGLVGEGIDTTFIHDSHASGIVEGTFRAGGAVGAIWGSPGTVVLERVWSDADVTVATAEFDVGGLIGNLTGSAIEDCYAVGDVFALESTEVGGLIGFLDASATISNSYASNAFVKGADSVGGLVGLSDFGTVIANSFTTSNVTGTTTVGRLVGDDSWVTLDNSYYGNASACTVLSGGACNTAGLEADTATDPDYFFDGGAPIDVWDLSSTWILPGGALPLLR